MSRTDTHREEQSDPGPQPEGVCPFMRTGPDVIHPESENGEVRDDRAERGGERENEETFADLRGCEGQ